MDEPLRVELSRTLAAPPERVWAALTRPEEIARWCCPDPGARVTVDTDARPGGRWTIRMELADATHVASGVYRTIDSPRALAHTWDWENEGPRMGVDTVVTVELEAVDGGTRLTFTHEGFPDAAARDGHEQGWEMCLDRLVPLFR